jgi:hypothetical protein
MSTEYQLCVKLLLKPIYEQLPPCVKVKFNNERLFDGKLTDSVDFEINRYVPAGMHSISVQYYDKTDSQQAVVVERVEFNQISTPKLILAGIYTPEYPEPWASEQLEKGTQLEPILPQHTYLGWNGVWQLDFTVPVFTWIHQTENLGWIYD